MPAANPTSAWINGETVIETFPVAGAFTISRGSQTDVTVVRLTLTHRGHRGQAECRPYARYGETPEGTATAIFNLLDDAGPGLDRAGLNRYLDPSAARNAIDCALWDLEAKQRGTPVWSLAGLAEPVPVTTAFTISWGTPDAMAAATAREAARPLLKIKLGAGPIGEHLTAVRRSAPKARLIVDANEAWDEMTLGPNLALCAAAGVELVEQPVPSGSDRLLAGVARNLAICADESAHDCASLAALTGLYDAVNIKLDKTGGLTEALKMRDLARSSGLRVMAGCMLGTSLAMAPALLIAQGVDWVDLDAPLLLAADRPVPIRYDGSLVHPPSPGLWG